MPDAPLDAQILALSEGRAVADLSDVELTVVAGRDARAWLHDLVTTDVESLGPGETRPSLLLSPTGRIRAGFHVLNSGQDEFLLAQRAGQPAPIAEILAPYVLSSEVVLRPSPLRLVGVPIRAGESDGLPHSSRPSVLGAGFDLLVEPGEAGRPGDLLVELGIPDGVPVGVEAVEAYRIGLGAPRFPADLDGESLPAEAGWDRAPTTDRTKGCFLGQEAVAKVADRGHPTRIVVPVRAEDPLEAGEPVVANGSPVGTITSAAAGLGIARIRWDARDAPLRRASGTPLGRR